MKEELYIINALKDNGYPLAVIEKYHNNSPSKQSDRDPPDATVVMPYVKNLSESFRRILSHLSIRTCFKPRVTLRQILVHPQTKHQNIKKNGVVYEIPCGTCNKVYVGQSGRTLEHSMKEHQRSLTSTNCSYYTSAVAEHAVHNNHVIDWKKAKVVDHRSSWKQRCIMESWYIAKQGNNAMNRDTGMLPGVYKSII